jgi:hypothetical protein
VVLLHLTTALPGRLYSAEQLLKLLKAAEHLRHPHESLQEEEQKATLQVERLLMKMLPQEAD